MLEDLSKSIPAYEGYSRAMGSCNAHNEASHYRLLELLGYVYADVVQFCHDIVRLFAPRKNGKIPAACFKCF